MALNCLLRQIRLNNFNKIKRTLDYNPNFIRDVDKFDESICDACMYGNKLIVELIIQNGANVHNGALYSASISGHIEIVIMLLNMGVNVNEPIYNNETSLFGASRFGHVEIVVLLIERGADVHAFNDNNETVLFVACRYSNIDVIKTLISNGGETDLMTRDKFGRYPIHHACMYGRKNVVELLIKHNPLLVNVVDYRRRSPLHYACQNGHVEIVNILINSGAKINIVDKYRRSPIYYIQHPTHDKSFMIDNIVFNDRRSWAIRKKIKEMLENAQRIERKKQLTLKQLCYLICIQNKMDISEIPKNIVDECEQSLKN